MMIMIYILHAYAISIAATPSSNNMDSLTLCRTHQLPYSCNSVTFLFFFQHIYTKTLFSPGFPLYSLEDFASIFNEFKYHDRPQV